MAIATPERGIAERDFELTEEQQAAVEWADGPLMVLAGAGTGKTTVVVERVRHLLASDPALAPENVLVLTYNVKAAAELLDRFEAALGLETASRLWVHNFHSFGNRVLTDHRADLGLAASSDVLDQVGQRLLLRQLRAQFIDFVYHPMARDVNAAGRFADVISRAKDELVTPAGVRRLRPGAARGVRPDVRRRRVRQAAGHASGARRAGQPVAGQGCPHRACRERSRRGAQARRSRGTP